MISRHGCKFEQEDENVPPNIRSLFNLYNNNILIEVNISWGQDHCEKYPEITMQGLFHCVKCLQSWRDQRPSDQKCSENTHIAQDSELIQVNTEEALHVLKILANQSYSDDPQATYVLNKIVKDEKFSSLPADIYKKENEDGQIFLRSQNAQLLPGTFCFLQPTMSGCEEVSLTFKPAFTAAKIDSAKIRKNFCICHHDDSVTELNATAGEKFSFQLSSGLPVDLKSIFEEGLLFSIGTREYYVTVKKDNSNSHSMLTFITDSGKLYWKRIEQQIGLDCNLSSHAIEIFKSLHKTFPGVFPDKAFSKREWHHIKNGRISNISLKIPQPIQTKLMSAKNNTKLYVGGEIYPDGNLRPEGKTTSFCEGNLCITPEKNQEFRRLQYSDIDCRFRYSDNVNLMENHSSLQGRSELPQFSAMQPSGTPLDDQTERGRSRYSREIGIRNSSMSSLRGLESGKSFDGISRTPSVVSIRELDAQENQELLQKRSKNLLSRGQGEVLNPNVRNRTGKPTTKPGVLADSASAAQGVGDLTQLAQSSVQVNKHKDKLTTSTNNEKTANTDQMSRTSFSGQQRFTNPLSGRNMVANRKSLMQQEGSKANTPSTFARQREIEKKSKKEKEEVKAKYQFAAHHSVMTGASHDQLSLGGTKTSSAGLSKRESVLEATETQANKVPIMTPFTGDIKLSRPKRRQRRAVKKMSQILADSSGSVNEEKAAKESKEDFLEEIPLEILDDFFLSDDEEYSFSDLSSLSDFEDEDEKKRKSDKAAIFPIIDGITILNFTQNFQFSYFMMPRYVKEKNQSTKRGILKLPVINKHAASKRKKRVRKGEVGVPNKERSGLMKRIDKLNRFEGTADPRVRQ